MIKCTGAAAFSFYFASLILFPLSASATLLGDMELKDVNYRYDATSDKMVKVDSKAPAPKGTVLFQIKVVNDKDILHFQSEGAEWRSYDQPIPKGNGDMVIRNLAQRYKSLPTNLSVSQLPSSNTNEQVNTRRLGATGARASSSSSPSQEEPASRQRARAGQNSPQRASSSSSSQIQSTIIDEGATTDSASLPKANLMKQMKNFGTVYQYDPQARIMVEVNAGVRVQEGTVLFRIEKYKGQQTLYLQHVVPGGAGWITHGKVIPEGEGDNLIAYLVQKYGKMTGRSRGVSSLVPKPWVTYENQEEEAASRRGCVRRTGGATAFSNPRFSRQEEEPSARPTRTGSPGQRNPQNPNASFRFDSFQSSLKEASRSRSSSPSGSDKRF